MSLHGASVRIIIKEPEERVGKNLFGTIISDRGGKTLMVRLTEPISGKQLKSDLLRLSPVDPVATFRPLEQYYGLEISAHLVVEQKGDDESLFSGVVALD